MGGRAHGMGQVSRRWPHDRYTHAATIPIDQGCPLVATMRLLYQRGRGRERQAWATR